MLVRAYHRADDVAHMSASLTKEHFEHVAAMFRSAAQYAGSGPEGVAAERMRLAIAVRLARIYEVANPEFKRTRFLTACMFRTPRRGGSAKPVTAAVKNSAADPERKTDDYYPNGI
jgi:hypothetical protein